MARFEAAHSLHGETEHGEGRAPGRALVGVVTAVIAVLAALATLFANHSSVTALAGKNEAILYQSQASDQYGYYESQRIRAQVDQAMLDAGIATAIGRATIHARLTRENARTDVILTKAQQLEEHARERFEGSEKIMASYERYEVAAVLFQISIVLVSMTALTQRGLLLLGGGAVTIAGLGFLIAGFVA
ncbi:MAG TPA: DUF4337 family protein [Candidatus Baltobacteraceae bacterium]|jgi:hypothetical protein|nr:DUF4337 family protein [Candidatus Baltobacteraceae bacterium]